MARTRSSSNALVRLLASAAVPIYAVDDQRTLLYCNPACLEWLGVEQAELVGQTCSYQIAEPSGGESDAIAALCPPPESFAGQPKSAVIQCRDAEGNPSRRRADFLPLAADNIAGAGVLVVVSGSELGSDSESRRESESEAEWLHRRLGQVRELLRPISGPHQLVGESAVIRRTRQQLRAAMATDANTLVVGPLGSGRERIARAVYYGQHQGEPPGPLVPLPCNLLDAELLQSTIREVKSRAQGAVPRGPAALLMLDVDLLSEQSQAELRGFLNIPNFTLPIIATSQQPLPELLNQESFSSDVAHLLSGVVIDIPPLSERPDDIPLLAQWLLERENEAAARQLSGFSPEAMDLLAAYSWPNDLEELEATVRDVCRRAGGLQVSLQDLPQHLQWAVDELGDAPRDEDPIQLDQFLAEIEAELIARALRQAKGNKAQAARQLGVSRAKLLRRIAHLGLE